MALSPPRLDYYWQMQPPETGSFLILSDQWFLARNNLWPCVISSVDPSRTAASLVLGAPQREISSQLHADGAPAIDGEAGLGSWANIQALAVLVLSAGKSAPSRSIAGGCGTLGTEWARKKRTRN
ncbi:hypothetical protein FE257_001078 [Aspergillus nanangensis]|uniref:Uncharacterized protein n=1 Tax=Aspergillus nanangensis TaxID=2582783 RepID=A0AAD4GXA3_ASPNN|nr:hypothetical protein FE257_001078 [Aspergillus nanangensis]